MNPVSSPPPMQPLKRSNLFLDASERPPLKSPRLDLRHSLLNLESKRHHSIDQLSSGHVISTEPVFSNASTSTEPPELSSETGQQDTNLTLGQIHHGNSMALINQMLEIQKYTVLREQSEEWAANLRFLHVEKLGPRGQIRHIPLTRKGEYRDHSDYVAVSYRWQIPSDPEPNPAYLIIEEDCDARGNKAPNSILNPAITFAQDNEIPFIWIDQECIPNREDNPEQHGIAIQAMDIVYRQSDHPLGLLKCKLSQNHLLLLHELLERPISRDKFTGSECWVVEPSVEEIPPIRDLLHEILIHEWWDRAWVFQEKHSGSVKMTVGLPYGSIADYSHNGDSPGEFYFKSALFRRIVTLFRPGFKQFGPEFGRFLDKAKTYTILNRHGTNDGRSVPRFKAHSADVISDIDHGSCERAMDRLAIIANCRGATTQHLYAVSPTNL